MKFYLLTPKSDLRFKCMDRRIDFGKGELCVHNGELCLMEFEFVQGGLPNIDEIHPKPTGKYICLHCAKIRLYLPR